jgi:hypothetical protein
MSTDLFEEIYERLEKNGLKPEILTENMCIMIFNVPAGRKEYECILCYDDLELNELKNGEIEKYNFIEGYQAIWSSTDKKNRM